jgi:hypothetical protein
VDVEILGEEARHYHPQPVVHPAGGVEATHGRIDHGVAGTPLAPGGEGIRIPAPRQAAVSGLKGRFMERLGISTSKWR